MMPADDFDRLLEHSRWVRTLGVRLAGASEGEDVAQEAWLVALARGDGVRAPAAWLRGVVRKLAGEQRRGAERRARREAAAAVPEGVPGPDELVAEAELTRELIRAVTELEEPFRSTVLLRYSRGLEPDEIARQEGVPAATVRTRLHRAHEKLRARLDKTHSGRAAWALAFLGPGALEGAGTVTWTGGLMASKTGLAAALAVVVGVGAWFGLRESGAAGAQGPVAEEVEEQVEVARELPEVPAAETSGPTARSQRAAAAEASPSFEELLLYGSVLDTEGNPVELESVAFEDELGHSLSQWKPGTGSYALAGIRPGTVTLSVRAAGYLPHVEELRLAGEREHVRHDVELVRGLAIPFRVLDENGKRVTWLDEERHYEVELALTRTGRPVSDYRERFARTRELGDVSWANDERLEGLAPGFSGLLRLAVVPPIEVHACFEGLVFDSARVDGEMDELVLHVDRAKLDAGLGTVSCRFVDAVSGAALTDGMVGVDYGNRYSRGNAPLDPEGRVELTGVPAGIQRLRYFHEDHEDFTRAITIPAGGVLELGDVRVWPRARVRGTLLGANGEPAYGTVDWVCEEGAVGSADLRDRGLQATQGGQFDIDRVARTRIRLLARIADHAPAAFLVDASSGDVEGLELRFEAGVPVKLRGVGGRALTLLDAAGLPWIPLASDQFRLPPGHHTIEVGSGGDARRVELEVGSEPLVLDLAEGG